MKNAKCKVQSEKWKIFVMLCCGAAVTKTHRASRREHSVKECHEVLQFKNMVNKSIEKGAIREPYKPKQPTTPQLYFRSSSRSF
jgi:hypothetical protein